MMKLAWAGALAGLSLLATAPVLAQTHGVHPNAASATAQASPPLPASSVAPSASAANKAKARYADCIRRYKDRKGCRYLAWRKLS